MIYGNLILFGNRTFWKSWKRPEQKQPNIGIISSWKSCIWDQYFPENMKWKFGSMGSISINKYEMESLNLWNFETLKSWDLGIFGTLESLKHGNSETLKLRNLKFLLSVKGNSRTPQHSGSQPCTSPPLGGHEWTWGTRVNLVLVIATSIWGCWWLRIDSQRSNFRCRRI